MNVRYTAPSADEFECRYLLQNFVHCLDEKAKRDNVSVRKCDVNFLPYFGLECPKDMQRFKDKNQLKQIFQASRNPEYESHLIQVLKAFSNE